jgi:hypothetical protein
VLIAVNIESRISEKRSRNYPLTAKQKASNTEKSRIRSRDEIIFSAPSSHGSTLRSNNRNDESGLQHYPSGDSSRDPSRTTQLNEMGYLSLRLPKTQKPQPKFIKNFAKLSCKNKIF